MSSYRNPQSQDQRHSIRFGRINFTNGQSAVGSSPSPSMGWLYTVAGHDYTLQPVNTTGTATLNY